MSAAFDLHEVSSIYVEPAERFVVSLIVGYSPEHDSVHSARQAAHWALELTRDGGCDGTNWFVYDRVNKQMHCFEQSAFADDDFSICGTPDCGGDAEDGEGWDGFCGTCADRQARTSS